MVEPGAHEHAEDLVDVVPRGPVNPEVFLDDLLDRAEGEGRGHVDVGPGVAVILRVEVLGDALNVVDLDVRGQLGVGPGYRVGLVD